jgi:hypothetical protein
MSTGRYYVKDLKSGRKFCIEPLRDRNQKEDDVTFKNGGITGDSVKFHGEVKGGSITPDESIITPENGFKNIIITDKGVSPEGVIEQLLKNTI